MSPRRWIAPILAALCAALPAAAQERARFANPPSELTPDGVETWVRAHIDLGPYKALGSTGGGVEFILASPYQDLIGGDSIRAWIRTEYFNPQVVGDTTYRSVNELREFDCKERRFRTLATDSYPLLNLQGTVDSHDEQAPAWEYLRPGVITRAELRAACALRTERIAAEIKRVREATQR
jgi:hypothetical protein